MGLTFKCLENFILHLTSCKHGGNNCDYLKINITIDSLEIPLPLSAWNFVTVEPGSNFMASIVLELSFVSIYKTQKKINYQHILKSNFLRQFQLNLIISKKKKKNCILNIINMNIKHALK